VSLERAAGRVAHGRTWPALRRFWVARIARLYPAYWLSLLGLLVVHRLGRHPYPTLFRHHPLRSWAAESSMLQGYLGVPDLQGVYWTLAFELAFYGLVTVAFVLGVLRHSVGLAGLAVGGAVVLSVAGRTTHHHVPLGVANIATMFVGTVLWRVREGQVGRRTGWFAYAAGLLGIEVALAVQVGGRGVDTTTADVAGWRADALAWFAAYAVVGTVFALRDRWSPPRALVRVGLVSYSTYLVHPLVLDTWGVHRTSTAPVAVTILLTVVVSLTLAAVSYRWVERPSVALGRRLAGSPPRAEPAVPGGAGPA
jgi:peptidoglycan/LPS O-acetylase OafA/YrhL